MDTAASPGAANTGRGAKVALCCALVGVIVLVTAIAGGITYLVISQNQAQERAEAAVSTFEGSGFRFDYPVEWTEAAPEVGIQNPEQVVELEDDGRYTYLTVLDKHGVLAVEDVCAENAELIDSQGLGEDMNEVIGERDVDGRNALHHRAITVEREDNGRPSLIDTWCIPKPDGVVLLVIQTFVDHGADDEPQPSPDAEAILDSWEWDPTTEVEG